jgi:hypothetical protein
MTIPPELEHSRRYAMSDAEDQLKFDKLVRSVARTEGEAQSPRFWHAVKRARQELGVNASHTERYARASAILPTMT